MEITRIEKACIALSRQRGERARECWCLGVSEGIVGDGAGHVEDAAAACDGRRHAAVVEQVGLEQPQPLRGAVQPQQVRVLGVACARIDGHIRYTLAQSL